MISNYLHSDNNCQYRFAYMALILVVKAVVQYIFAKKPQKQEQGERTIVRMFISVSRLLKATIVPTLLALGQVEHSLVQAVLLTESSRSIGACQDHDMSYHVSLIKNVKDPSLHQVSLPNQSFKQSINQSINQPTDRSID